MFRINFNSNMSGGMIVLQTAICWDLVNKTAIA